MDEMLDEEPEMMNPGNGFTASRSYHYNDYVVEYLT